MLFIRSKDNERVKYVKKLAQRRFRDREGKFVLEGFRAVEEAFKAGFPPELVMLTPSAQAAPEGKRILSLAGREGVAIYGVADNLMREMAGTQTPQGILAVAKRREDALEQILSRGPSLLVLVDGVQDPGNLGTIIRTSAAAGAQGVVVLPGTVDPWNPKVVRATMGNLFRLPVVTMREWEDVAARLKNAGLKIITGDPGADKPIYRVNLTSPVVLVAGNEAGGAGEDIAGHGIRVSIPMTGGVDSLNVAVAVGIMLYETVRQRSVN